MPILGLDPGPIDSQCARLSARACLGKKPLTVLVNGLSALVNYRKRLRR
jgi:hypothetical protein